jgi:AAA15 family ATPase/GTPase
MTENHLKALKLRNFKQFETFEAKDFGAFNLIVGDNNTGKTTLLESLLFFGPNYEFNLKNLIEIGISRLYERGINLIGKNEISFLDFYKGKHSYNVLNNYLTSEEIDYELNLQTTTLLELNQKELESIKTEITLNKGKQNIIKHILKESSNAKGNMPIESLSYKFIPNNEEYFSDDLYLPFVGYGISYANDVVDFYSSLTSESDIPKDELIENLKLFIPDIKDISINTALIPKTSTILILEKEKNKIPLPQYGDGVNQYFRYLLELQMCKGKMLMIDTGIHHSKLKKLLKAVIVKAKKYEVQIFATTHSKECMEAYSEAIAELLEEEKEVAKEDYKIISLQRINEKEVESYTYSYDGFSSAMQTDTEIR